MRKTIQHKAQALVMHRSTNYIMAAVALAAAVFYVYCANMAVRTLTVLENTKEEMQALHMKVSDMESQRLSVQNKVSTENALLLGFVEVNNPVFVMRNSSKTALSLKTD